MMVAKESAILGIPVQVEHDSGLKANAVPV